MFRSFCKLVAATAKAENISPGKAVTNLTAEYIECAMHGDDVVANGKMALEMSAACLTSDEPEVVEIAKQQFTKSCFIPTRT